MTLPLSVFAAIAAVSGYGAIVERSKACAIVFAMSITAFAVLAVIGGG
jgi:hypothetical protein